MRLIDVLTGRTDRRGEARAVDASLFTTLAGWPERKVYAGVTVNNSEAVRYIPVFASANLIADAISTMPLSANIRASDDSRVPAPRQPIWLDPMPNPETYIGDMVHRALESLLIGGEAHILITARDRLERPAELWTLSPQDMRPDRSTGELMWEWRGDSSRLLRPFTARRPDGDLITIKGWQGPGDRGLNPIEVARQSIGLGLALEKYGATFFANGATPAGVLSFPNQLKDDDVKLIKQEWGRHHSGTDKAHKVGILSGGATWNGVSMDNDTAQFIDSRKMQRNEIAMLYRVPPHLVSDVERSTSWGTGIAEQNLGFLTYTLLPWIRRLETALTATLAKGEFLRFNFDGLLRADQKARYEAYAKGRQFGWLSTNDIRRLEDMPPIEGGDVYLQPVNMRNVLDEGGAGDLAVRANSAALLIRSGFTPQAALEAVGLDPIDHFGLLPVTLQADANDPAAGAARAAVPWADPAGLPDDFLVPS